MLSVHNEGWFICEQHCGKKFKSKKLLDAHVQRFEVAMIEKEEHIY